MGERSGGRLLVQVVWRVCMEKDVYCCCCRCCESEDGPFLFLLIKYRRLLIIIKMYDIGFVEIYRRIVNRPESKTTEQREPLLRSQTHTLPLIGTV